MNDVLVLNKNFYAIQIVDWKKAVSLLYQGLADALDENYATYDFETWAELSAAMKESPNGFVRSPRYKIAVPDIIRLNKYDRLPKREVKFTRRNIYQHYHYKCCYCGNKFDTKDLNLDHVIPKSRGGKTETYRGKNTERKPKVFKVCEVCSVIISSKAKRCRTCESKHRINKNTKINWPDTLYLIERLKVVPCTTLAKELGVSDTSIKNRIHYSRIEPVF